MFYAAPSSWLAHSIEWCIVADATAVFVILRVSNVSKRGVSKELQAQIYFWNKWRPTVEQFTYKNAWKQPICRTAFHQKHQSDNNYTQKKMSE